MIKFALQFDKHMWLAHAHIEFLLSQQLLIIDVHFYGCHASTCLTSNLHEVVLGGYGCTNMCKVASIQTSSTTFLFCSCTDLSAD